MEQFYQWTQENYWKSVGERVLIFSYVRMKASTFPCCFFPKDLFLANREEILEYSSIGNIGILTVDYPY